MENRPRPIKETKIGQTNVEFYTAHDPILNKRVPHIKIGKIYISLITKHYFSEDGKMMGKIG